MTHNQALEWTQPQLDRNCSNQLRISWYWYLKGGLYSDAKGRNRYQDSDIKRYPEIFKEVE
jgi:hypothetical protein